MRLYPEKIKINFGTKCLGAKCLGRGTSEMKYYYKTATGKVEIEVDEKWGELLREMDAKEYNRNRAETRRHCSLDEVSSKLCDPTNIEQEYIEKESQEEARKMVHDAIDTLNPKQQSVITEKYFHKKTNTQIAKEMGVVESVARRYSKRAEKNIKNFCESYWQKQKNDI